MNQKKILILEDDPFLVKVMQKKFEKENYEVNILLDGLKAVETARSFQPNFILSDLIMPDKDGFEAVRELKTDPSTKDIPIIISSNLGSDEDIKKIKDLGASKYFIKSNFNLNEIIEYINGL